MPNGRKFVVFCVASCNFVWKARVMSQSIKKSLIVRKASPPSESVTKRIKGNKGKQKGDLDFPLNFGREIKQNRNHYICIALLWFSVSGGKVPQDRTIIRSVTRTVSLPLFVCMCVISSIGIVIALGLVLFNIWNSHRR